MLTETNDCLEEDEEREWACGCFICGAKVGKDAIYRIGATQTQVYLCKSCARDRDDILVQCALCGGRRRPVQNMAWAPRMGDGWVCVGGCPVEEAS
jgi:hypothetical protein